MSEHPHPRRMFVSEADERNYLSDMIRARLRGRHKPWIESLLGRFHELLARAGLDDRSIVLQEHWAVLHEAEGRIAQAIEHREREVELIETLFSLGGPIGPINHRFLKETLRTLRQNCLRVGDTARADLVRQRIEALSADRQPVPEPRSLEVCQRDCGPLIDRGLELHDSSQFAEALLYFDRALQVTPDCPFALYDRANTLHSMGRDHEAEQLLRGLIAAAPEELFDRCPVSNVASVHIDAHLLLFRVLLYGRGFSEEAFAFAKTHLSLRRRGVNSAW